MRVAKARGAHLAHRGVVAAQARGARFAHRGVVATASLLLGLVAACASTTPAALTRPRTGPVVLPAGGSSYLSFDASRVERVKDGEVEWQEDHTAASDPVAAACDLGSAWAAVGYRSQIAFAQLASRRVLWTANPFAAWSGARAGLSLRGSTATLWKDSRVMAVRVPKGDVLWDTDVREHLESTDLNRLDYALPRGDDEVVVLASREGSAFTDGVVRVQRIDRSRGDWRIRNENTLRGLTWVHRATSEGDALFVAGVREEVQLGGPGRLWQWLVVNRVDLESLEVTELVSSEIQKRETVVRDFAVGTDVFGLLLDEGTVQIYRVVDGRGASAPIVERTYDAADSIAWISEDELVVLTPSGPEVLRY